MSNLMRPIFLPSALFRGKYDGQYCLENELYVGLIGIGQHVAHV